MTYFRTVKVDNQAIFYREAGSRNRPTLLLLHGFPTSSHMFRNLIPALSDCFYVIAPDFPGFGNSAMPDVNEFEYTFDHLAEVMERFVEKIGLSRYSLYLMDYGAPIGYRLVVRHPDRIDSLIIQNGNAYEEGLREFWDPIRRYWDEPTQENSKPLVEFITPEGVQWQYTHGARNKAAVSPDSWNMDLCHLSRKGNSEIQLALLYDYRNNVPLYPAWQAYFRDYQPRTLIMWGENDYIFPAEAAQAYKRDLREVEFHLLNTGHFALEEDGDVIADRIHNFLLRGVALDKNIAV